MKLFLKTCLAITFLLATTLGCSQTANIDNTAQAYLFSALEGGKEKVIAVNEKGQTVNRFDVRQVQPVGTFDLWQDYFATGFGIWHTPLHYWMGGNNNGYGFENICLISPGGEQLTPAKYTDIWQIDETTFLCSFEDTQLDVIDSTGAQIGQITSFEPMSYAVSEGIIQVALSDVGAVKGKNSNTTVPEGTSYFTKDLTPIATGFADGYIFSSGLCAVYQDNSWGFIDVSGNMAISPQFTEVVSFYGDHCAVSKGEGMTLIRKDGTQVSDKVYDDMIIFPGGAVGVKEGELWGYCDKNLKPITSAKFETLTPFINGISIAYIATEEAETTYIVMEDGREYKLPENIQAQDVFSNCVTAYDLTTNKMGVYDLSGKWVVSPKYDYIIPSPAGDGAVLYSFNEEGEDIMGYIDGNYNTVLKEAYTSIEYTDGKVFVVFNGGNVLLLGKNGETIAQFNLPPQALNENADTLEDIGDF